MYVFWDILGDKCETLLFLMATKTDERLLAMKISPVECLLLVCAPGQMRAFLNVVRLISRRDIVWF